MLTPELPTLRQVQRSVQAEVVTEYGLGLRDRVGFRVFGLANPTRLVVDVAHQPSQPFGSEQVTISGPHSDVMVYGIRTGRHPGYDRVVFDLRGNAPRDLVVGYDGAGAVIQVVMFAGFRPENFHATYTGPPSVAVGLPAIRNVAHLPVHAGEGAPELLGFSIDTRHRHGFRVFILSGAGRTRLVVDAAV